MCADYFFPKDAPGHKQGVTAFAVMDRASKFLAGHVVEAKGAGPHNAVSQVLTYLRNTGHFDKVVIRTDQEASIMDLLKSVAKRKRCIQYSIGDSLQKSLQGQRRGAAARQPAQAARRASAGSLRLAEWLCRGLPGRWPRGMTSGCRL